ncbi:Hypothetical predicted protein, partial [Paramuricea clavata]
MDRGEVCGVIYLDLKKAFDTVNHAILLQKLKWIGVNSKSFQSYLSHRTQKTVVNNCYSNQSKVSIGVPQGGGQRLTSFGSLEVTIDDHTPGRESSYKYLGIVINEAFSWADHIDYVRAKVAKRLSNTSNIYCHSIQDDSSLLALIPVKDERLKPKRT